MEYKQLDSKIFNQIFKIDVGYLYPTSKRAHIFLGEHCSYKCVFCYGNSYRNNFFIPKEHIIEYMKFIHSYGIEEIEITGGEPTQYLELEYILKIARNLFKKIAIITNGSAPLYYYKKIDRYIDEYLFSLHGYNEESHEKITGIKSSWERINNIIKWCDANNKFIRINCTICKYNYTNLDIHAKYVIDNIKNVHSINYLPANSWDDAIANGDFSVPFYEYSEKIKEAINIIDDKCIVSIRYVPFCVFSPDMRKYIKGHLQHMHDKFDWNQELDGKTIYNNYLKYNYGFFALDSILKKRESLYAKFDFCMKCDCRNICDGFQKNQIQREIKYIPEYIKNVSTETIITNPLYYIK